MRQSIWNMRIPNVAGFFLLLFVLSMTTMLVRSGVFFPVRATPSSVPQNVQVSNVTDTSFTVSYTTSEATTGSLAYGPIETYGNVELDDRDKGREAQLHTIHFITVQGLQPQTQYYFGIISGSATFTNNGTPYSVMTGETITKPSKSTFSIQGAAVLPDGKYPAEAFIYIQIANHQPAAALLQLNGSYIISLANIRTADLSSYPTFDTKAPVEITMATNTLQSQIKTTLDKTQPIPSITLSQDYDFTLTPDGESPTTSPTTEDTDTTNFPDFSSSDVVATEPQILTPKADEGFADPQPQFRGTAFPNRSVEIVLTSTTDIKATVRTNKNGAWSYRPNKPLLPGTYTLRMTTRDEAGILRTLTQSFAIYAEGSQFTEPSVAPDETPTPTASPTATVTPTIIVLPTAPVTISPTVFLTPTNTPLPLPTLTPTQSVIQQPTIPLQPPPKDPPGSQGVLVTLSIAGFAILAGSVLFFITHGGM